MRIFIILLIFLLHTQYTHQITNLNAADDGVITYDFPFDKTEKFETLFAKEGLPHIENGDEDGYKQLNNNMKYIFPNNRTMVFSLDSNGKIIECTNAEYRIEEPKILFDKSYLDFDILIATCFGRRSYWIDCNGTKQHEWGNETSSYWCMGHCEKQSLIALVDSNNSKIDIIHAKTLDLFYTISGYVSTAVYIDIGQVYFTAETQRPGSDNGSHWEEHALYRFDLRNKTIHRLTEENLKSPRGIARYRQYIIISDTFNNDIKFFNIQKGYTLEKKYTGFSMQNKIHITKDNRLLVADEHHHCIREINLFSNKESRYHTPIGLLLNPANAYEIPSGIHKNKWLITDSENLQVTLFDTLTNEAKVLVENLNSALMVIPFNFR